jgi:hypothetical protein
VTVDDDGPVRLVLRDQAQIGAEVFAVSVQRPM